MTYLTGFLPVDLHIVSEVDLRLLQRGATVPGGGAGDGAFQRIPGPGGALERVLDEVERREFLDAGHQEYMP